MISQVGGHGFGCPHNCALPVHFPLFFIHTFIPTQFHFLPLNNTSSAFVIWVLAKCVLFLNLGFSLSIHVLYPHCVARLVLCLLHSALSPAHAPLLPTPTRGVLPPPRGPRGGSWGRAPEAGLRVRRHAPWCPVPTLGISQLPAFAIPTHETWFPSAFL